MRLEPGITCVVGPNGSGKSNVVDALAWVMGEQGAKTLRGGNMADVIFAGTSSRPALGRAQVELTIDNSDGALPIEYSEVTISRTLFRGGGSEYSVNGAPARLLDIQELLSDTGMGRQMHVIVGQGQLDAILSATPEDRRGFIEEAAGVLKHRRRKERALKKLGDMDANLVRVLDLTNEIHRQLGPLARQAKAARRAHRIQAALRDAKARLLADDIVSARERLNARGHDDQAMQARLASLHEHTTTLRRRLASLEEEELAAASSVENAASAWQRAMAVHERLGATLLAAQERVSLHSRSLDAPTGDTPEELDQRAQAASTEDAAILAEVETHKSALQAAIRTKEEAEARDEAAAKELARSHRTLADYREKVARLTGDVASAQSRFEAASAEAQRAAKVVADAHTRAQEAAAALPEHDETEDNDTPVSQAHLHAQARRDAARAAVDELLAVEREARADRASWESRRDALAQSLTPSDATAALKGRRGVDRELPSYLKVTPGYEDAISALLHPFDDAMVVDDFGVVVDQLRQGRQEQSGRIRMVVAAGSQMPGDEGSQASAAGVATTSAHGGATDAATIAEAGPGQSQLLPLPHGAAWAIHCVDRAAVVARAVDTLLAGAVICADLDQADELLARTDVSRVVTQRGEVLTSVSASGQGTVTSSPLTLHAHYDEAVAGAQAAEQRQMEAAQRLSHANAELDEAIRAANDALKALRAHDAERAKAAQERARLTSAAQAAAAEAERAATVEQRAQQQVEWARARVEEARERLEAATQLAPPENLAQAQTTADEASAAARAARENETAARLELRAIEERSRQVQARARHLRQGAARAREERDAYRRREAERQAAFQQAQGVVDGTRKALDAAVRILEKATQARDTVAQNRTQRLHDLAAARQALNDAATQEAELREASHRDEIARAELRLRLEQVEARSLEELSLEADALITEFGPHLLAPENLIDYDPDCDTQPPMVPYVRAQQEAALERAGRELARLGKVNPLALEEHEALAKRHEFLVSQVHDLKKSKADLLRIVDDVDRLVEEAFTKAWEDTSAQFETVFATLFPGGTGRLVLTEPEDMLTTGIEIEAKPAGKKVKRLSLLSGGERSLAALAFLVAIFHARPSPFYVMDEVEAALDDVNLSRLLEVFKKLQESSQLIVITHQKRTMEIADALYGVTMREGVTRVVSQRLSQG